MLQAVFIYTKSTEWTVDEGEFQKQFYVNEVSGVYILNVITNKGSFIHKVIKQ